MITSCDFNGVRNLRIFAPKLKQLVIGKCHVDVKENGIPVFTEIKVYAPNLISMKCNNYMTIDCSMVNIGALVNAYIGIDIYTRELPVDRTTEYGDCIVRFLRAGSNVKFLKLSPWVLKKGIMEPPMYRYYDGKKLSSKGEYWEAGLSLQCSLDHLKFVEIYGVLGCVNELKFLEILLKFSVVLEKMVIFTTSLSSRKDE
ncbi:hypothetical protein GIB67_016484 [Kingdonia uniflora]|uniref:FBD domain-containing protein n=1 Tax=Kingdonia uniflora TaxID=39325 RepID=A0A7J7M811_9MAGN|nr:hypothetical protein GIB67_016484 [Kingdonia uniflora]